MEENLELEQDIDVDEEFDTDVEETENEEIEITDDEELEYDDDGNVIEAESEDNDVTAQVEERDTNDTDTKETVSSKEDINLRKKYDDREAMIKDLLNAMGIEVDNVDDGLIKLVTDATGDTEEQYKKKREDARKTEEAQRVYREVMMERMIASDMAELHSLFPETKSIAKFEELPNCRRYAELRDKGLSVREAYSAANPEVRRETIVNSVKQQTINASKAHLKSNVPIASRDTSVKITRGEMEQMRELFPDKSDKELVALYKKTR